MINKIGDSITMFTKTFDKASENILKDTSLKRNRLIKDIVDSVEIRNFTEYNIKALKTYDEIIGTLLDIKK